MAAKKKVLSKKKVSSEKAPGAKKKKRKAKKTAWDKQVISARKAARDLNDEERRILDLYRGGGEPFQGVAWRCYKEIRPKVTDATARQQGARLVNSDRAKRYLADCADRLGEKCDVSQERVIQELAQLGFSDARQLFSDDGTLLPPNEWPDSVALAVAGVDVFEEYEGTGKDKQFIGYTKKVRLWSKPDSLDKLAKTLGMYLADNKQKRPQLVVKDFTGEGQSTDEGEE